MIPVSPTPPEHISSDEAWYINGVSLMQYGWSVTTIGGGRYDLPTRRGSNTKIPFRPGAWHKPKMADERVIVLQMWLTATNPGTGEIGDSLKTQFNDSWDFIRRLVWQFNGQQVTLTKSWYQTDPQDNKVKLFTADALAEVTDAMQPTMTGRGRADFQMQLHMASPYFFGPWQQVTVPLNEQVTIYNPGHDIAMFENFSVEFHGTLNRPTLYNLTASPTIRFRYNTTVLSNPVICDVPNWLANVQNTGQNVIKYTMNSGSKWWFGLIPGANLLQLRTSDFIANSADLGKEGTSIKIDDGENVSSSINVREASDPPIREADSNGYAIVKFRPPYI